MTEIKEKVTSAELTTEQPESTDSDYLAWVEQKIRHAVAEAVAHPEKRIPQSEIWKKTALNANCRPKAAASAITHEAIKRGTF
jgi:hypothetical protein